jgi:hypothetical protein
MALHTRYPICVTRRLYVLQPDPPPNKQTNKAKHYEIKQSKSKQKQEQRQHQKNKQTKLNKKT